MSGMFQQYHNFLTASVLKKLQDTYMRDDILWVHRNYGRFFIYLDNDDHEKVLEDLYNNENLPIFHNNRMMRNHHMYIQRFVPGSWLPLHREKCYGVLTIYLNPDEDWDSENLGPKFVYYDTEDLNNLEEHRYEMDIHCNTGNIYMVEKGTTESQFNVFHKVELNETDNSRYAIQMFFGPGILSTTQDPLVGPNTADQGVMRHPPSKQKSSLVNQQSDVGNQHLYGDTNINQTHRAIMSGLLEVPDSESYTMNVEEWNKNNPKIIERLTRDG